MSGTGSIGLTALEGAVGTVTGEGAGVSFFVESDADDPFPLFKEPVEVDNFMIIVWRILSVHAAALCNIVVRVFHPALAWDDHCSCVVVSGEVGGWVGKKGSIFWSCCFVLPPGGRKKGRELCFLFIGSLSIREEKE